MGAATTVLIDAFEVSPEADERFLKAWDADRFAGATLHRALRDDVDLRFVATSREDAADLPFRTHRGRYAVVQEDGDVDGAGGTVLVNPFEVPAGADDDFLAGWRRAREALARQPGCLGTRLHRSIGAADFRFVNVARWSSPLMFARAVGRPEFQEAAAMPFASHPALYEVIRC